MATILQTSQTRWRRLMSATIVAVSLCVVWGLLCGWGFSLVEQWTRTDRVSELLQITRAGTPVITNCINNNWQDVTYLSLDREPILIDSNDMLSGTQFQQAYRSPGLFATEVDWRLRIIGTSNYSKPFASWYFIRDGKRPGRGYFEIYDPASKMPIAYASRAGVMPTKPSEEAWFEVGNGSIDYQGGAGIVGGQFMPGQYIYRNVHLVEVDDGTTLPRWKVFLQDGEQIVEINMRKKRMKTLMTVKGLRGLASLSQPVHARRVKTNAATGDNDLAMFIVVPAATNNIPIAVRLAARTKEEILLIDPSTEQIQRFQLPEAYQTGPIMVHSLGDQSTSEGGRAGEAIPQLLVCHSYYSRKGVADLAWIDSSGNILREKNVQLAGYDQQTSPHKMAWGMALVVPVSAMWILGCMIGAPLNLMQANVAADFSAAFAKTIDIAWPPLLAILLLSLILAAIAWRWHRQTYRAHAGLWATFVFLFGPAGLAAYALYWRPSPVDQCQACGKEVPRDRPHCPACQTAWPAPASIDTEIFAA